MDHVLIRIAKFGYENQEFTLRELKDKIILSNINEWNYILKLFDKSSSSNPNAIAVRIEKSTDELDSKYILLPSTLFSFIDHLELQEARKNSRDAKRLSWIAIAISIASFIAAIFQVIKTP